MIGARRPRCAFLRAESRAAEPILPLHLFRNRVFAVTSAIGFVIGFALFGALTYLPLFQQVVRGDSPTESGLQLIPVMAGVLIGSIGSGQVITATGRYKVFPIAGTAIAADRDAAAVAPGRRDLDAVRAPSRCSCMGLGLGLVMQVLVLAVQNAVDYSELGVATSGATLFRSMGGSLGTAVLGAIFTARLTDELAGSPAARVRGRLDRTQRAAAPARPRSATATPARSRDSLSTVFLVAAAIVAVAFLLSWLIEERPLRQTVETAGVGEAFAVADERRLAARADPRARPPRRPRAHAARSSSAPSTRPASTCPPAPRGCSSRAHEGVDLDDPDAIAAEPPDRRRLGRASRSTCSTSAGSSTATHVTDAGHATAERLLDARAASACSALVADWSPDEDPRINDAIARLARELAARGPGAPLDRRCAIGRRQNASRGTVRLGGPRRSRVAVASRVLPDGRSPQRVMSGHPGRRDHGLPWARGWWGAHREIRRRRSRWRLRSKVGRHRALVCRRRCWRPSGCPDGSIRRSGRWSSSTGCRCPDTVERSYDSLDLLRGDRGVPELHAGRVDARDAQRLAQRRADASNVLACTDPQATSAQLVLTANTDTTYGTSFLDLRTRRADSDRGTPELAELRRRRRGSATSPTWASPARIRAQGGKYLFLPPGYDGRRPGRLLRRPLADLLELARDPRARRDREPGDDAHLSAALADSIRRRWSSSTSPEVAFNGIHANDFSFFEEVNTIVQEEPSEALDPERAGQLAALGIVARASRSRPTSGCARSSTRPRGSRRASRARSLYKPRDPARLLLPRRLMEDRVRRRQLRVPRQRRPAARRPRDDALRRHRHHPRDDPRRTSASAPSTPSPPRTPTGAWLDGGNALHAHPARRRSPPRPSGRSTSTTPRPAPLLQTDNP